MNQHDGNLHAVPPKWVFALAAIVILAAVASVIVWLFNVSFQLQFPVIVALLCFVLATLSNLLFVARTNVQATLPLATITMGGPAVTWVATVLIFAFLFPTPSLRPEDFVAILRAQSQQGWKTYPEWVKELGSVRELVLREEASNVRQLMDTAYFLGSGRRKLTSPNIQVLFVYFDNNQAIKFERVTAAQSNFAEIYFKGHATTGKSSSMLLAKNRGIITVSDVGTESEWRQVTSDPLDCLIITFYEEEGMFPEGDLLFVNTSKYRKDGNVTLDFGILAPQTIEVPKGWLVRAFPFPLPDEVPVLFSKVNEPWNQNVDPLILQFSEWMTLINQKQPVGKLSAEASGFLKTVRDRLPQSDFSSFQNSGIFISKYWLHVENLRDAVSVTIERK
jgi:hypothetical protein